MKTCSLPEKTPEMLAEEILVRERSGWGSDKNVFPISFDDISALVAGGATFVEKNKDNRDGTHYTKVTFQGFSFECSSTKKV